MALPNPSDRADSDLTMMYALHAAFRRDLGYLTRAATSRYAEDPAKATALAAGWEIFKWNIHHHHSSEDRGIWPRARNHLVGRPDDLAVLDAMEAEHQHIDPALEEVEAAFGDRSGGAPDANRIAEAVAVLRDRVTGHFEHEERDAVPLLMATLTRTEWDDFGNEQRRSVGFKQAGNYFAWLLEGNTEHEKAVLGMLPPPLRFVFRRYFQPRYARTPHWS